VRLIGWAVLLLAGCAEHPDVRAAGSDTYTVSERYPAERAGVLIAQNVALSQARDFCRAHGGEFLAVANHVGHVAATDEATYTVDFRCLPPDSPELRRPTHTILPEPRA
jgi:hypothetical protein